jgi:exportin-2 (importin alpha re-exporter)
MIALANPADRTVRAQVAETVALVASTDFPDEWPDLIDVRARTPARRAC